MDTNYSLEGVRDLACDGGGICKTTDRVGLIPDNTVVALKGVCPSAYSEATAPLWPVSGIAAQSHTSAKSSKNTLYDPDL